jgi:hypothetical protein
MRLKAHVSRRDSIIQPRTTAAVVPGRFGDLPWVLGRNHQHNSERVASSSTFVFFVLFVASCFRRL